MTVSLNEISNLVQQLESIIDDSDKDVINIAVSVIGGGSYVHISWTLFLSEFVDFDVVCLGEERDYSFEFTKKIFGVEFMSLMSTAEIVDLKTTMPEQWEYIQQKLQTE